MFIFGLTHLFKP